MQYGRRTAMRQGSLKRAFTYFADGELFNRRAAMQQ